MKHLLVASLLLLCHFGAFSQDSWQWLNPQPAAFNNLQITFTDSQHGFILNYNGDLMSTSDQGAHWQTTGHFRLGYIMSIADSTGVIICSDGKFFVSSDNGSTWNLLPSSFSGGISSVSIVSRDTFFLSAYQLIYKTTDRGKTLTPINSPSANSACTFLDSKTGFSSGSQATYKTIDGGQTWIKKDSAFNIRLLRFVNVDTGFAVGGYDSLLRTYDGGETWQALDTIPYNANTPYVYDAQFVNSKTGFAAVGYEGILRTDDGGTTWTIFAPADQAKSATYAIIKLCILDKNTGFGIGNGGRIAKTTNGGQTWRAYSPTYLPITTATFPTPQTGYMSDWYTTFKTTDGGQHWDSLTVDTTTSIQQIHFSSADTGYFISANPVREHRTTDGGKTWTVFNPASTDLANAPGQFYFGPHSGFLSCKNQLLKTVNDGVSWSMVWQDQGNGVYLDLIFFTDSLNGFATAYNKLMKTTDGGVTWSLTYTGNRGFSGLWFFDPLNGYLVDTQPGGVGFVTHDGGISFSPQQFPQYFVGAMHTIGFFNRQIGYFTSDGNGDFGNGSFGHTYKTIDGGKTWQLSIDDVQGNSIVFTNDSSVLIAGNGGQLIKSKISGGLQVGSLTVNDDNACGENFTLIVGAAFSNADSISFLYTDPNGKTDTLTATPDHVYNGFATCTASAKGFIPGNVYTARARLKYNGVYQLSNTINFIPIGISRPTIKDSADFLVSSVDSGNHWFRNGSAIPSAVGRLYYPDISGIYSVQTITDSCRSAMSDTMNIILDCTTQQPVPAPTITYNAGVLTSSASQGNHWFLNGVEIADAYDQQYTPLVGGDYSARINTHCTISPMSNVINNMVNNAGPAIRIYPNPVSNQLVIDNKDGAPLEFEIMNIYGQSILTGNSSNNQISINTRTLPSGQYIIRIKNRDTSLTSSILFVKF